MDNSGRCFITEVLGKINDLPPSWNFTIAGLVAICEDGETAIKSQLAELEQWGYVKKTLLMPNESPTGRISYLYDFYEYSELDDSIPKYDIEMETFTADTAACRYATYQVRYRHLIPSSNLHISQSWK